MISTEIFFVSYLFEVWWFHIFLFAHPYLSRSSSFLHETDLEMNLPVRPSGCHNMHVFHNISQILGGMLGRMLCLMGVAIFAVDRILIVPVLESVKHPSLPFRFRALYLVDRI